MKKEESKINDLLSLEIIKETVERLMCLKNISNESRQKSYVHARYVYYEVCRVYYEELGKPSLAEIGNIVGRDHATVIHGNRMFAKLYSTPKFRGNLCYDDALEYLDDFINGDITDFNREGLTELQITKLEHIARYDRMSQKYRETINKIHYKLITYRSNPFIKKVLELPPEDIKELEEKFNVFFKVKNKLNKTA